MNDNLNELPNENYKKLFEKFKEIEKLEVSKWNTNHVLGYFLKKYKNQYNVDYKFKFNTPAPSKCFEVFQTRRLANLLSSDPIILKEYIDWIFETKVVKAKRRLTSISFMIVDSFITEYKRMLLLENEKTFSRNTILPDKYLNVLKNSNLDSIKTYGDLAFLYQVPNIVKENNSTFEQMKMLGFNFDNLNKII